MSTKRNVSIPSQHLGYNGDMPYTTNPHLPKVRRNAVRLVKYRDWSMRKVARHLGVQPSTISRWCKLDPTGGWREIPTRSSRPRSHSKALPRETVLAIVQKRSGRRRCGQVIHQELLRDGVVVSLSSVQRTLERCHLLKKRSPWKRPHDYTPRPEVTKAGDLLEIDTVHFVLPDGSRLYAYTLIDLYSRWAYAEAAEKIGVEPSVQFLKRAREEAPFAFNLIQSDHGSEFSIGFTHTCLSWQMQHRHSRVRQSNDNAHIERFNRTLQEECLDLTNHTLENFAVAIKRYLTYYNTERLHMGINYQTPEEVLRRY